MMEIDRKTTKIQAMLFEMQDLEYKAFHSKLMPTVDKAKIIGIRVPILRKFAKELSKVWAVKDESANYDGIRKNDIIEFMNTLPHQYYEEDNLHAFLIEGIKLYEDCILALDDFLPRVDNWATCDSLKPKVFKKNKDKLLKAIYRWLESEAVYEVRFAINMLMTHYLDEDFKTEYLENVARIKSEEYYINMMIAWYFATALAKQYDEAIVYIEERRLPEWVHRKTIQKAVESYRITAEQKEYLKKLK